MTTFSLKAPQAGQVFEVSDGSVYTADASAVISGISAGTDIRDLLTAGCIFLGANGTGINKLDGTTAPGVDDDTTLNFAVGSIWIDVTGNAGYFCTDATEGAAVWTGFPSSTTVVAGGSGTAGHVDIYPTTASKGKTRYNAVDNTNNDTLTIQNAEMGQATTLTIPDPDASAANYMLSPLTRATNAITAFATGGQASAVALTSIFNTITVCATAADSVKLPAATAGTFLAVSNGGAAYANVFPVTSDIINELAANAPISLPTGQTIYFSCTVAGTWKATPIRAAGAKFTTGTTATTFAAGQLSGGDNVVYTNTQGTPGSLVTRTATQMFADDPFARVGQAYRLRVVNGQGTGTLTITAGSGVTLTGTATVAADTARDFVVTYTSATALVIQNIGEATFS